MNIPDDSERASLMINTNNSNSKSMFWTTSPLFYLTVQHKTLPLDMQLCTHTATIEAEYREVACMPSTKICRWSRLELAGVRVALGDSSDLKILELGGGSGLMCAQQLTPGQNKSKSSTSQRGVAG